MMYIYVVCCRTKGVSGNVIQYSDSATTNRDRAVARAHELNQRYSDDPDYLAYVEIVQFID